MSVLDMIAAMLAELTAFGAWWWQELRNIWSRGYVLDLSGECAVLKGADGDLIESGQAWPQAPSSAARLTVVLPESATLTCSLRLPPMPERAIANAVALQLERVLPLSQDRLYIDWRVQDRKPDLSRIVVVTMARREYVDALHRSIRSWGWRVVEQRRWTFVIGRRERLLAWSSLALCVTGVLLILGQWMYERSSLAEPLQRARQQVREIRSRETALGTGALPIAALSETMRSSSAVGALAAVTAAVPADSWLYELDVRAPVGSATLTAEGYTPSAATLVQALERSAEIEAVELVDAAAEAGTTASRVEIKARLERSARP